MAKPIRNKLIVGGIVLAAAVGYLAYTGMKKGWVYYVDVDKFCSDAQLGRQRVRLYGKVGEDQLIIGRGQMVAQFQLLGQSSRLAVLYRGAIPDQFAAGREVVVEGRLDRQGGQRGVFNADVLLTKCASKYQAQANAAEASK